MKLISRIQGKVGQAINVLRNGGVGGLSNYLRYLIRNNSERRKYHRWIRSFESPGKAKLAGTFETFTRPPLISVLVPVYNTDARWLQRCIESVIGQLYQRWELCIADDESTAPHVREVLEKYAEDDGRIKVVFREENGHISAASNSALELATGEFSVLLDHDDELSSDALYHVARTLREFPATAMIYSDEDLIDESGRRFDPKFKPDFSRDLLYSTNLITHLSGYDTDLLREIGGFRLGFEGSQDYDLALRAIEQIGETQIRHIPHILYHWRTIRGSVAFSMSEKPYAHDRARKAIREHLERRGHTVEVHEAPHYLHRVKYIGPTPQVSLIVSEGEGFASDDQVIHVEKADATALNDAVARSDGDVIVFLDGDLAPQSSDVIDELASFAVQPGIGAVAGKIVGGDTLVEQAGMILDRDLSPMYAHRGFPHDAPGNISRNLLTSNYCAVSISCMAMSRASFDAVSGFDATVAAGMFDVDICLRLREMGKRVVVAPHVVFTRRGASPERKLTAAQLAGFRDRWPQYIDRDPFCNLNLGRNGRFEIEL